MSLPRATLPRELCDLIIDYLHTERASLATCALVCRAWVPTSRFHLFDYISLSENKGHAAVRLNTLLASPHASITPAVRRLDLFDALAPIQITYPHNRARAPEIKPLLALVPHIARLTHIHTLALSDLPFDLLPPFPRVRHLLLVGVTAGSALLRLAAALPALAHLTLTRVHAIPYRPPYSPPPELEASATLSLRTLTVRGSSIAFLGLLGVLAPRTAALEVTDMYPSEMHYLIAYLEALAAPLVRLELALAPWEGATDSDVVWEELAQALGVQTMLVLRIAVADLSEEKEGENMYKLAEEEALRAHFKELDALGMLTIMVPSFDAADTSESDYLLATE